MTKNDTQFTPQSQGYNVEELFSSFNFEVPIYQRVFTWDEVQFERLFKDLREHFCSTDGTGQYYLGVITVVRSRTRDILVDGQQRLTCIMLLGALLRWNLNPCKLTYAARPTDKKALEDVYSLCMRTMQPSLDDIAKVGNIAMAGFLRFASTGEGWEMLTALHCQSQTIKKQLTLMVSVLPSKPYQDDIFEQNRYFEKMNYGGKQLEPHEILKVQMCKDLESIWLKTWNSISDFGRCYVPEATDNESYAIDKYPLSAVLASNCTPLEKGKDSLLARVYKRCEDKNQLRQYELGAEERDDFRKGLISFQVFLLHVRKLYLQIEKESDCQIGNESQLLDLFRSLAELQPNEREKFVRLMKDYRLFLDWNIVHIITIDGESRYSFYCKDKINGIRDVVPDEKKDCMQFQSMLYVSSGVDQKWLLDAYMDFRSKGNAEYTLDSLKKLLLDDRVGMLDSKIKASILESSQWPDWCLRYGTDNRRWLALLDYIIWEKFSKKHDGLQRMLECDKFHPYKSEIVSAIQNFVFRKNRSVEHLHAQTDKNATTPEEWERDKDIFGNLALISAGRNSEYGNLSVGGKTDRVVKLLKEGGRTGSKIESIKLLLMLSKCNGEDDKWNVKVTREHADEMMVFLKQFLSAPGSREKFDILPDGRNVDLSEAVATLGMFIENNFFNSHLPNGFALYAAEGEDAESPNEWCGRYFLIKCPDREAIKCWVGWRYGGNEKIAYRDEIDFSETPSFAIQIPPDVFPNLAEGWYKTIWIGKWRNKELSSFDIHNRNAWTKTAEEFKAEICRLCESYHTAN